MTPAQQRKATRLLAKVLEARDFMDAGAAIDAEVDNNLTLDIRMFLIRLGAIPDRRKKGGTA
jgi:hypothetical protein